MLVIISVIATIAFAIEFYLTTTEPHGSVVGCLIRGQAVTGSNRALGYLVSPFRKVNKIGDLEKESTLETVVLCAILKFVLKKNSSCILKEINITISREYAWDRNGWRKKIWGAGKSR